MPECAAWDGGGRAVAKRFRRIYDADKVEDVPVWINLFGPCARIGRALGLGIDLPDLTDDAGTDALWQMPGDEWKNPFEGWVADTERRGDHDWMRLADYPFGNAFFDLEEGVKFYTTVAGLAECLAFVASLADKGVRLCDRDFMGRHSGAVGSCVWVSQAISGGGFPDAAPAFGALGLRRPDSSLWVMPQGWQPSPGWVPEDRAPLTAGSVPITVRWSGDPNPIARAMGLGVTLPPHDAWQDDWKAPLEGKVADTMRGIDGDVVRLAGYPFGDAVFDIWEGMSLTVAADRIADALTLVYSLRDRGAPIRRAADGRLNVTVEPAAGPGMPDCALAMMAAGLVPASPLEPGRTAIWEPPQSECSTTAG